MNHKNRERFATHKTRDVTIDSMDVTPKAFRDVQFREKLRGGYHPEDVDEFLEQAAVGVEALIERLQQATERAQRAEQAASEANASDETLKRMLVLAQRTVDQAVKEANDDAERLLSKARGQADSLGSESRARRRRSCLMRAPKPRPSCLRPKHTQTDFCQTPRSAVALLTRATSPRAAPAWRWPARPFNRLSKRRRRCEIGST